MLKYLGSDAWWKTKQETELITLTPKNMGNMIDTLSLKKLITKLII